MNLERVTSTSHPMYRRAWELYRASFPPHEQREKLSQEKIIKDREYHFCLISEEEVFVGLVLYWETDRTIYIEHFCILPEMRNRRYGQKVLSLLQQKHKTLLLEIDPPIENLSKRRKVFYERCGFVENPYHHIHPPYHRENKAHSLIIMTYPHQITREHYNAFLEYLHDRVMNKAFE